MQGKKKPRKEMRQRRRALKAEINRLKDHLSNCIIENSHLKYTLQSYRSRIESGRYRVSQIIPYHDIEILGAERIIKDNMVHQIAKALEEKGYITFRTEEDRVTGNGIIITAEITAVKIER